MQRLPGTPFLMGLILAGTPTLTTHAEVRLPALISDSMVVQRDSDVRVWGWADPGEGVAVTMAGATARAAAGADGAWAVHIGPFKAGGPHRMTIAGKNEITVENVLVGEVWIASGQSNMEWPLRDAERGAEEIARANHPSLRLFTVSKATSMEPGEDVHGSWAECVPETAGAFSAVAYFFGRELSKSLDVPVGLIHSSWGGTPAEAWTSPDALAAHEELQPMLEWLHPPGESLDEEIRRHEAAVAAWEKENVLQDTGNAGLEQGFAAPDTRDADWESMQLPQPWETAGLAIDGAVWFRRAVDLPSAWAGKDLRLALGPIDDFDTTYFNGAPVGATGAETVNAWTQPRAYDVPAALVHDGRNIIAVRVFDHAGDGGFTGVPDDMALSLGDQPPLPLAGDWRYRVERTAEERQVDWGSRPPAPFGAGNPSTPTSLYHAMLAPLTPYAIRGAIWYQGEANAGRAEEYRVLFPAMIRDWRRAWGQGNFPFLFVQLANFMARRDDPGESDWAELREAQMLTLSEPACGMAVIIDIGNADDIHPRNKHDVGHRLALWALATTYGQPVEYSGPLYQAHAVEGSTVRVRFAHGAGLRSSDGGPLKGFAVAGPDGPFVWATAEIDGDSVMVSSDAVPSPAAVRYAWADNPEANLANEAGLPASPFRTDGPRR